MQYACKVAEIPNWGKKVVTVNGQEVLLVNVKGALYACENECPHQGSPLNGGIVKEGPFLSCPRHGYRFNLQSGACSDYPEYTLKTYAVQVVGEDVMVGVE